MSPNSRPPPATLPAACCSLSQVQQESAGETGNGVLPVPVVEKKNYWRAPLLPGRKAVLMEGGMSCPPVSTTVAPLIIVRLSPT